MAPGPYDPAGPAPPYDPAAPYPPAGHVPYQNGAGPLTTPTASNGPTPVETDAPTNIGYDVTGRRKILDVYDLIK